MVPNKTFTRDIFNYLSIILQHKQCVQFPLLFPSIQLTFLFCNTAVESLFLFMPGVPRDNRDSSSSSSSYSAGFSNIFPVVIFVVVAFAVLKTSFKEVCNSSAFWGLEGSLVLDDCVTDLSTSLPDEFIVICFRKPLEFSKVFVSKFCWLSSVLFSMVAWRHVSLGMDVGSAVAVVLVFLVSEGIDWSFLHNSAFDSNSLTRSGWEKKQTFQFNITKLVRIFHSRCCDAFERLW